MAKEEEEEEEETKAKKKEGDDLEEEKKIFKVIGKCHEKQTKQNETFRSKKMLIPNM